MNTLKNSHNTEEFSSAKLTALNFAPFIFILLWASGSTFVKLGLTDSSVWTFLFLRSLFTVLTVFLICNFIKDTRKLGREERIYNRRNSILSGFFLQFMYQSLLYLAIDSGLSIGLAALIMGLQPLLTPFVAREKISKKMIVVLFTAFAGLALTVIGYKKIEGFTFLGFIFAFFSMISITIGSILQKKNTSLIFDNLKIQYITSLILFLISLFFCKWSLNLTSSFVISIIWVIFIVSISANFLLIFMMKNTLSSKVSSLFFCVPPLTMILDYIFFSTKISLISAIGTLIIIFSVKFYYSLK